MPKIEAVLFDWGGVLIDNPSPGLMAYCADALGVPVEDYLRAHKEYAEAFQKGLIPEAAFWQRVCEHLGRPRPQVNSLWGDAFRAAYSPRWEVFDLACQLRENGCRTGLLTNTEAPAMEFFLGLGYDVFDALTFSCTEGACKPQREIYETAARRVAVAPEQCVLIDDRLDFVEGAQDAGLTGILYERLAQVRQELIRLGVRVY